MKKIFTLIAFFFSVLGLSAQGEPAAPPIKLKLRAGSVLAYDVNANGKQYQFIITIKDLKKGIVFDWKMTDPVSTQGNVVISPGAADSARVLMNFFAGGNAVLNNETAVWISKRCFDELTKGENTTVAFDDRPAETLVYTEEGLYETRYMDGMNTLQAMYCKTSESGFEMTVAYDAEFPIILSMNLGWTIYLNEIKY